MSKKSSTHQVGRDARNGQFIPVKDARRDPQHTTVETVKNPPKKK